MNWLPASQAPENRVVLTRTGASWRFSYHRKGVWRTIRGSDMPTPREWLAPEGQE